MIDQALTSAENFVVGIILVRNCPPAEFGLYVFGYGILVLSWSVLAALITAQMAAVFTGGSLSEAERKTKCESLLWVLSVASLATAFGGCVATLALGRLHVMSETDTGYWLFLCSALPGMCLRDFMRRYCFQERSETRALVMDAVALMLTVTLLGAAAALPIDHLNRVAIAILAVGGLAVGAWNVFTCGLSPRRHRGAFQSLWSAGRWNIGATLITWIQNQAYVMFATTMLGLTGLAAANAPRVLLTPITLLTTGLALPLLPRFARQSSDLSTIVGTRSMGMLVGATTALVALYTFALWLARDSLLPLVLNDRYGNVWPCILAWAIASVFTNIRIYYSTFLLAKIRFRRLAVANIASAVVVLGISAPFIHFMGAVGSIYSLAVGEFLFGAAVWHQCRIVAADIQWSLEPQVFRGRI